METINLIIKNPYLLFIVFFFYGSILFGYLLSKIFYKEDVRKYGDGNPGTWNAFKVGGAKIGIPTLLWDYSKGLLPVLVSKRLYDDKIFFFTLVSIAPILGHTFSPFLKFKGGKGIATSFGLWTGITLWQGPTIMGFSALFSCSLQNNSAICSIISFISLLIYLLFMNYEKGVLILYALNLIIVFIKLRKELFIKPTFGLRNPFKR